MASESDDVRYVYEKYQKNQFMSLEELNTFASFFIAVGKKPSWFTVIVFAVVMVGLLALFTIRNFMFNSELRFAKQGYERRRQNENRDDLKGDDQD